jgi:gentisate 1,2-dioxygenase
MADTAAGTDTSEQALERYYEGLRQEQLAPLWTSLANLVPPAPKTPAVAHLWRYQDVRKKLLQAGELVSAEEAERRVLMLLNPAPLVAARGGTTPTLYAGVQLVLPGEVARAHRHVMSALRFLIEAEDGAVTTVNGETVTMAPRDLVLTPNWHWHDHANESAAPVIWLDGLDVPLVNFFDACFFELYPEQRQLATKPADASGRLFPPGRLNPTWERGVGGSSPLFRYRWRDAEAALREALSLEGSPADGTLFEYTNPGTGGPAMPTLSCFIQALRPGQHTAAHRHTTSAVYHVVSGTGVTIVDGAELAWEQGDTFCLPSWATHEHENSSRREEAVLFSFTNQHVYETLGLYREELVPGQG